MTAKKKMKKAKKAPAKKAAQKKGFIKVGKLKFDKSFSESKSSIGLTPLGDKVIIRVEEAGEKILPSGIIIPETVNKEKADRGEVVAVGPGRFDEDGERRVPLDVSVGDKVLFQWGDKIEYGGKEYYLVGSNNILAIIN